MTAFSSGLLDGGHGVTKRTSVFKQLWAYGPLVLRTIGSTGYGPLVIQAIVPSGLWSYGPLVLLQGIISLVMTDRQIDRQITLFHQ